MPEWTWTRVSVDQIRRSNRTARPSDVTCLLISDHHYTSPQTLQQATRRVLCYKLFALYSISFTPHWVCTANSGWCMYSGLWDRILVVVGLAEQIYLGGAAPHQGLLLPHHHNHHWVLFTKVVAPHRWGTQFFVVLPKKRWETIPTLWNKPLFHCPCHNLHNHSQNMPKHIPVLHFL